MNTLINIKIKCTYVMSSSKRMIITNIKMNSTLLRSPYPGANFAYVVRPIPAGPGQALPGGCFRCRNARNKFSATRFAHFFIIEVPEVGPGFAT